MGICQVRRSVAVGSAVRGWMQSDGSRALPCANGFSFCIMHPSSLCSCKNHSGNCQGSIGLAFFAIWQKWGSPPTPPTFVHSRRECAAHRRPACAFGGLVYPVSTPHLSNRVLVCFSKAVAGGENPRATCVLAVLFSPSAVPHAWLSSAEDLPCPP